MIKCVAVDDEPIALGIIKEFASQIPFLKMEAYCSDSIEALSVIKSVKPDLVLLDIEMPEITGIELLKNMEEPSYVIFITAYSKYAVEGFDLNAIDFLLKPFSFERFMKAVSRAQETLELRKIACERIDGDECIYVKSEYQNYKVLLNDILYIEAMDNYIKIHTYSKIHVTLMNLKGVMKLLPENKFARVHRSYIVSLSKVRAFTRNRVVVEEKSLPVGKAYLKKFLERLETV